MPLFCFEGIGQCLPFALGVLGNASLLLWDKNVFMQSGAMAN